METEKGFLERYKDLTRDLALDLAYHMMVLQEQIKENYNSLARRFYSSKSEKVNPNQFSLFNEAELGEESASEEEKRAFWRRSCSEGKKEVRQIEILQYHSE